MILQRERSLENPLQTSILVWELLPLPRTQNEMVQTKFDSSSVGSMNSYQFLYTDANFPLYANKSVIPVLIQIE